MSPLPLSHTTYLYEVLAHLGPVEHGVEGGDLVDLDGRHVQHGGHLVHGRQRQPPTCLSLRQVQHRDDGGLLVVPRIAGHDQLRLQPAA